MLLIKTSVILRVNNLNQFTDLMFSYSNPLYPSIIFIIIIIKLIVFLSYFSPETQPLAVETKVSPDISPESSPRSDQSADKSGDSGISGDHAHSDHRIDSPGHVRYIF